MPQDRPYLFDVSRLIWRLRADRQPTGIDRVCLAYLERYADRSLAVIIRQEFRIVLDAASSDRLFRLMLQGQVRRRSVATLLAWATLRPSRQPLHGKIYLNLGHTGLDAPGLTSWVARHGLKAIYLIHDLIPITHPQYCRAGEAARHHARMRTALESAHGVIANSADTERALRHFAARCGLPVPPIQVAWLGTPPRLAAKPADHGVQPYFVCISTLEARKNHLLLLQVWSRLAQRLGRDTPQLVLIGQRGWEASNVFTLLDNDPVIRAHVRELGECDDDTMLATLDGARALLMPSHVEGFGLPVIEALQRGVPVIASDLPVFREFAGEIPLYLPTDAVARWEDAVVGFLDDANPERQRQLRAIPSYHAPSWAMHFAAVEPWLEQLCNQLPRGGVGDDVGAGAVGAGFAGAGGAASAALRRAS